MKVSIVCPISQSSFLFKMAILLCLLFSLVVSACAPPATEAPIATAPPTSTPVPALAIVTGGPCELNVGMTMPLAVTGMPSTNVAYRWIATSGKINPPDGPAVVYTAPDTPGDVIVRVEAEKDGVTSFATLNCTVIGPTPTPTVVATLAPTFTPIPSPTAWECTSFRSQKVQSADIPGQVTIDAPSQGTLNLPSGQQVQAGGSYTGIPKDQYLWVFIYSAQAGLRGRYYPQTRDAAHGWQPDPTSEQGGRWSLIINFGAPHLCYEVIVMVADAAASQSIADQLQRWAAVNNYAGYELNGLPSADPPDAPGFPDGLVEKASIEVKTR